MNTATRKTESGSLVLSQTFAVALNSKHALLKAFGWPRLDGVACGLTKQHTARHAHIQRLDAVGHWDVHLQAICFGHHVSLDVITPLSGE
jgi:hypothetical protein